MWQRGKERKGNFLEIILRKVKVRKWRETLVSRKGERIREKKQKKKEKYGGKRSGVYLERGKGN